MNQTSIDPSPISQGNDDDTPLPGHEFAQFSAGCFSVYELVFQRVMGVTQTEVGYSQGIIDNPSYEDVCSGTTGHSAVVRVQYDPKDCSYESLLDALWTWHSPPTIYCHNGNDEGPQHRSGIYFYTPEQEKVAKESLERKQQQTEGKIMTEILPAKKFYRAEDRHQQYLSKGGEFRDQSTDKGCNDPIYVIGSAV